VVHVYLVLTGPRVLPILLALLTVPLRRIASHLTDKHVPLLQILVDHVLAGLLVLLEIQTLNVQSIVPVLLIVLLSIDKRALLQPILAVLA
jgi:hypothetical protein